MNFVKEKEKIRERMKLLRARQDLLERSEKNKIIQKSLFSLKEFKKANIVSIYISRAGEAGTKNIIRKVFEIGKKIAVPSLKENKPCMCLISKRENLIKNTPFLKNSKKTTQVRHRELDLIIVPGIAFDKNGNRVGSGNSYYDIFLKKIKRKVPIIGLAYDFQILKEIPKEPHDILIDKIITEKRIIIC